MSLYLKYRPKTFDEIVGQPDAVKLMKAIVAQNPEDRPKVFLFGGASGCRQGLPSLLYLRGRLGVILTTQTLRLWMRQKTAALTGSENCVT